jgi:glycosyltransferase involved in cell wall biosynthesis
MDTKNCRLSLCMIVKNEEKYLAQCLLNAKGIVDEIIVVDTGSTDRTKEIAASFGALVFDFEWTNDFSKARNFSISKATGHWILILDADEILSPSDHYTLKSLINHSGLYPFAYSVQTRNYTLNTNIVGWEANDGTYHREEAGTGWFASTKVRLFQNHPHIKFRFPVHERVEPSLAEKNIQVSTCPIPVHHYGQLDEKTNAKKGAAYFEIGLLKLSELNDDPASIRELAIQAGNMGKWNESIKIWNMFASHRPDFAETYINTGTAYWNLGEYEKALEHAKKAIELAPEMKESHFNCAISLVLLGKAKEAITVLKRLVKASPSYLAAQFMLGAAYVCHGKTAQGLACFNQLEKVFPGQTLSVSLLDLAQRLATAKQSGYASALLKTAKENYMAITKGYRTCVA